MSDIDVGGLLGTVIVGGMAMKMVEGMGNNNHHHHEYQEHQHQSKRKQSITHGTRKVSHPHKGGTHYGGFGNYRNPLV